MDYRRIRAPVVLCVALLACLVSMGVASAYEFKDYVWDIPGGGSVDVKEYYYAAGDHVPANTKSGYTTYTQNLFKWVVNSTVNLSEFAVANPYGAAVVNEANTVFPNVPDPSITVYQWQFTPGASWDWKWVPNSSYLDSATGTFLVWSKASHGEVTGHVVTQDGVTVTGPVSGPVPEPGSLSLLCMGLLGLQWPSLETSLNYRYSVSSVANSGETSLCREQDRLLPCSRLSELRDGPA